MASLEAALSFFRAFEMEAKKGLLTEQAEQIGAYQDATAASRGKLVDVVKGFKKGSDAEKLEGINGVLKAFQEEVDTLTKRSRYAEKAFLQLFKELLDAPDPAPLLAAAAETARSNARLADENGSLTTELEASRAAATRAAEEAKAEAARLREEVVELEDELSKLRNQDITIRELERRVHDFESIMEMQIAARLEAREAELKRAFELELDGIREAEAAMEGRVASLQSALAEAVAARDEAQAALYGGRGSASGGAGGRGGAGRGRGGEGEGGSGEAVPASPGPSSGARLDALLRDNEELVTRVSLLEREAEGLRLQLAAVSAAASRDSSSNGAASGTPTPGAPGAPGASDPFAAFRMQITAQRSRAEAAEDELARVSASLAALQADAAGWATMVEGLRTSHEASEQAAAAALALKDKELQEARTALAAITAGTARAEQLQVAALKKQVAALEALLFSAGAEEEGGSNNSSGAEAGSEAPGASPRGVTDESEGADGGAASAPDLHALLVRRLKQLESRAVLAERAAEEHRKAAEVLRGELVSAHATLAENKALIARLEDSLSDKLGGGAAGAVASSSAGAAAGAAGVAASGPGGSSPASSLLAPEKQLAAILGAASGGDGGGLSAAGGTGGGGGGGPMSMLAVLRDQRDRFRARVTELEGEVAARAADASSALANVQRLTADNVKLYEKVRYLQSVLASGGDVSSGGAGASSGGGAGGSGSTAIAVRSRPSANGAAPFSLVGDDDFDGPYRRMYNEALDPFSEFAKREKAKQYGRLNAAEKITLTSSQFFLGNKYARTFLFFYMLLMHALVFMTLWHFAHVSHRPGFCDSDEDHHPHVGGAAAFAGAAAEAAVAAAVAAGGGGGGGGMARLIPAALRGEAAIAGGAA